MAIWKSYLSLGIAVLLAAPLARADVDLRNIDRTIRKEPRYTHTPGYCMLVFGPEAKMHVWLVLDGLTLYVDRNGNGDLTEAGERIEISNHEHGFLLRGPRERARSKGDRSKTVEYDTGSFQVGDIVEPDGTRHQKLLVFLGKSHDISIFVKSGGIEQGSGSDSAGDLQFSNSPKSAPVIHFAGPLTMTLFDRTGGVFKTFPTGTVELYAAMVGTPGLGPGTFANVQLSGIPEGISPVADIRYPAQSPGQTEPRERVVLLTRC